MDEDDGMIEIDGGTARAVLIEVLRQYDTPARAVCGAWVALIGAAEVPPGDTLGRLVVHAADIGRKVHLIVRRQAAL